MTDYPHRSPNASNYLYQLWARGLESTGYRLLLEITTQHNTYGTFHHAMIPQQQSAARQQRHPSIYPSIHPSIQSVLPTHHRFPHTYNHTYIHTYTHSRFVLDRPRNRTDDRDARKSWISIQKENRVERKKQEADSLLLLETAQVGRFVEKGNVAFMHIRRYRLDATSKRYHSRSRDVPWSCCVKGREGQMCGQR